MNKPELVLKSTCAAGHPAELTRQRAIEVFDLDAVRLAETRDGQLPELPRDLCGSCQQAGKLQRPKDRRRAA